MATIEQRTTDAGKTVYRVKIRIKGTPPQTATFTRLTDAKKWIQNTESAIRERRYFKTNESMKHTLGEAIDRYIEHVLPTLPLITTTSLLHDYYRLLGRAILCGKI